MKKTNIAKALLPFALMGAPAVMANSSTRNGTKFKTKNVVVQNSSKATKGKMQKDVFKDPFSIFGNPKKKKVLKENSKSDVISFLESENLLKNNKEKVSISSGDTTSLVNRQDFASNNGRSCITNPLLPQCNGDTSAPTVNGITVSGSPSSSATSVTFSVDFSESVKNVDTSDFELTTTGSATGTVSAVSTATGDPITVTVNSISGVGTIRLDIKSSHNIQDTGGSNSLSGGYTSGATHTVNIDTTAPIFENSTPSTNNISTTTLDLKVDIDEGGTIYYVVVADGATAPTSSEVKARTASGGASAVTSGSQAVSSGNFSHTFNVSGLSASTAYDIYVVAQDDEGVANIQSNPTKVDVTTNSNNALYFDNDAKISGFSGVNPTNFTVEFNLYLDQNAPNNDWQGVYYNASDDTGFFVDEGNRLVLYITERAHYRFETAFDLKKWAHVAFTYDKSTNTVKGYIDGQEISVTSQNSASTNTMKLPNSSVTMGYGPGKFGNYSLFKGALDDFRIWDVVKTQPEIDANNDSELTNFTDSSLLRYFDFNQGNGGQTNSSETTLYDRTSNSSGTLSGFDLNGDASNWVSFSSFVTDITPPTVQSITLLNSPAQNATSLTYKITFNENASSVSIDDFDLITTTGTATGTIASVSSATGTDMNVTINSVDGIGILKLNLKANTDIVDDNGNGNNTNGYVPQFTNGDTHTAVVVDYDAQLVANNGVDESAEIKLPSTSNTLAEKVDLLDFTISDGGTSDSYTTDISEIRVNVMGTTTDLVRSKVKWLLNGNDASNVEGQYDSANDVIKFSSLNISVANNSSENYVVSAYFQNPTGLTDNSTIGLSVDGDSDLTFDVNKTRMSNSNTAVTNSTNAKVDITATKLIIIKTPSKIAEVN